MPFPVNPNPYEAPADKPIEAQRARPSRWWQRLLALDVPAVAGASIMCGIGCVYGGNWLVALVFFVDCRCGLAARLGLDAIEKFGLLA